MFKRLPVLLHTLAGTILLSTVPASSRAAVPRAISFQGVVAGSSGALLADGTYANVTFRLYDHATGTTQLWSETKSITVSGGHGLFNTVLGDTTAFPTALPFDQPYWLSVQIGSDAEMAPRIPLQSVPYALNVVNAWSLTGNAATLPGSTFLGTTDNHALEVKVNSQRALRLEPSVFSPNVIGGYNTNSVASGVYGATIAGGGVADSGGVMLSNRVAGLYGTVGGGYGNRAGDVTPGSFPNTSATIGGGVVNVAGGDSTTVGGGYSNIADGSHGTVGGGDTNAAHLTATTVAGGAHNTAAANDSTVGGGSSNTASGTAATVSGGDQNQASASYGAIPGGQLNTVSGSFGLAAGRRAKANEAGTFVWGDSTDADVTSHGANSFTARASGGFYLSTAATNGSYAWLPAGNPSWTVGSDRNIKANFAPVDGVDILDRLAAIPVETWNYKAQDPSIRHIGVMAQDFSAAFGLGEDDKHIGTVDAQGVAMASIQGLYRLVKEKDATLDAQQKQIAVLEAQVARFSGRTRPRKMNCAAWRPEWTWPRNRRLPALP